MAPQPTPLNYYAVLGVSQEASAEDLKARYQSLSRDPAASPHIQEAYEVLADAAKRSAYDSLLPGIQWKLKCMSVLGLFSPPASTAVADEEKEEADDGRPADLSVTLLEQALPVASPVQAELETKEPVDEATSIASSSPFSPAEMQEPGSNPANPAAMNLKNEETPDTTSIMVKEEVDSDGEQFEKATTTAEHKNWEWHQQREEARKLARLFSEKLIKDKTSLEIFERVQTLEEARVTNVTNLVAKKHAIEDLITDLCNIHTEPIIPKPLSPRPPHLRLSSEEVEKRQATDIHLQYIQRLLIERTKEVRVAGFKNEFRKLLDEFTVLNYKILSERIVAGLARDILKEAKDQRSAEKDFEDWFAELGKTESVRLKEVLRVAPEKDELMKVGMVEILTKEFEEGKFGGKRKC